MAQGPRLQQLQSIPLLLLALLGGVLFQAEATEELDGFDLDPADRGGADDPAYWNRMYEYQGKHGRDRYEWYGVDFETLRLTLKKLLPKLNEKVLLVGSGDSEVGIRMAELGWNVTNIDFSPHVTKHMAAAYPQHRFLTMDARNMTFPSESFHAVLDKGLTDCLGTDSERRRYFRELHRVLHVGGVMVVISQRQLEERSDLPAGWACEPRRALSGPLFVENSPTRPPLPVPGTENSIDYNMVVCRTLATIGPDRSEEWNGWF